MSLIRHGGVEKFLVRLDNPEDKASLKAALKASPGTDPGEPTGSGDTLSFDHDNPSNVVAFWAAEFEWDNQALKQALDQIAPLAWQQIGLFSGSMLRRWNKDNKGMMAGLAEFAQRKKTAEG